MSLQAFKKAWVTLVVDINKELSRRKIPSEKGVLSKAHNEDRLLAYISSIESAFLQNLGAINAIIEDIKQRSRRAKDEKRLKEKAFRDKLLRIAIKFSAGRGQGALYIPIC